MIDQPMMQMPRYNCFKKVWALKIKRVDINHEGKALLLIDDDGFAPVEVDKKYVDKHGPEAGGYYVVYADGYKSFSPAEAFEAGYVTDQRDVFLMPQIFSPDEFEAMSVPELAGTLRELKTALEVIGALKTKIQKSYDFLSIDVLPERMDEEGIQTLKIKDVGRLQMSTDIRCAIPAANRESVKEWLTANGHGSMVSETINASTLKAFVREMMKENKEWPEDLLKVSPYSRATVVKA